MANDNKSGGAGDREHAQGPSSERETRLNETPVDLISADRAQLVVIGLEVRSFPLPSEGEVIVGRSLRADVPVEDDAASRMHVALSVRPPSGSDPGLRIRDLGSSNGTRLAGRLIEAHQEYVLEPGDPIRLGSTTLIVRRGWVDAEALRSWVDARQKEPSGVEETAQGLVLEDEAMREIFRLADRVAGSTISVLVLGETGVGKEVLAKTIHARSKRAEKPFIAFNCGAFPADLLESELFGHERGAFTGAVKAKIGLLESAEGGTVFLDEAGEMPPATQVSLLRVLEERRVRRVGGVESIPIDIRLIAATNRDLEREVAEGRFRRDLYYRIAGFSLTLPPLRDRVKDISVLARTFASEFSQREGGRAEVQIGAEAIDLLSEYSWPGNVRELRNVIERAVVLARGGEIGVEHLPVAQLRGARREREESSEGAGRSEPRAGAISGAFRATHVDARDPAAQGKPIRGPLPGSVPWSEGDEDETAPDLKRESVDSASLRSDLERLEHRRILAALEACQGNQTRAAKMLGITRRALIFRLDRYGIDRPRKGKRPTGGEHEEG